MALVVRVIPDALNQPGFYTPRFGHMEILTNSPEDFKRWCWKHGHMDIHTERLKKPYKKYDRKFYLVKTYFRTSSGSKEEIIKYWGYYRPDYDPIPWYDKLSYNIDYYLGTIEPIFPYSY